MVRAKSDLYVYARIGGRNFQLQGYARAASASLDGEIRTRRHSGPPLEDEPLSYWVGPKIDLSRDRMSEQIEQLLEQLLATDPASFGGDVSIQIADMSRTIDDRGGYWLSLRALELLVKLRADIDIDVAQGDLC